LQEVNGLVRGFSGGNLNEQKPVIGDRADVVAHPFFLSINWLEMNVRALAGKHNSLNVQRATEQIADIAHKLIYPTRGGFTTRERWTAGD
jgi:hypothetical protein